MLGKYSDPKLSISMHASFSYHIATFLVRKKKKSVSKSIPEILEQIPEGQERAERLWKYQEASLTNLFETHFFL